MRGCVRIELYQGRDLVSRLAAFLGSPPDGIFVAIGASRRPAEPLGFLRALRPGGTEPPGLALGGLSGVCGPSYGLFEGGFGDPW
jgi:hypothetical protein